MFSVWGELSSWRVCIGVRARSNYHRPPAPSGGCCGVPVTTVVSTLVTKREVPARSSHFRCARVADDFLVDVLTLTRACGGCTPHSYIRHWSYIGGSGSRRIRRRLSLRITTEPAIRSSSTAGRLAKISRAWSTARRGVARRSSSTEGRSAC